MMKDEIYIGVKSLKIGCTQSPILSRQGPHLSWKKWVGNQTIHWAIILTFPSISYLTFAVHVLSLGTFSGCPQLVMINDQLTMATLWEWKWMIRLWNFPWPAHCFLQNCSPWWPCSTFYVLPFPHKVARVALFDTGQVAKWPGWTFHVLSSSSPKRAGPRPLFNVILLPPLPQMRCPTTQQTQPIIGKRFSSP